MLTQMTVVTSGITESPIPYDTTGTEETDPIQIINIDGLEPVTTSVNTAQYGSVDGEFYSGSTTGKRNIVITFRLNPDWNTFTQESLRQILYRYFLPKTEVTLEFDSTHLPKVTIDGIVESCEPTIFAKDGYVVVSIICPNPYFVAVDETALQGVTSQLTDTYFSEIDYEGSVETGFVLDIKGGTVLDGEVRVLTNVPSTLLFSVTGKVDVTHSLELSTVQGDKYINQKSSGGDTNIIGDASVGSAWFALQRGANLLQIQSDTGGQTWVLRYHARYGGL